MAIGDKVYIADKTTQDSIKTDTYALRNTDVPAIKADVASVKNTMQTEANAVTRYNSLTTKGANIEADTQDIQNRVTRIEADTQDIQNKFLGSTLRLDGYVFEATVDYTQKSVFKISGRGIINFCYLSLIWTEDTDVHVFLDGEEFATTRFDNTTTEWYTLDRDGSLKLYSQPLNYPLNLYFKESFEIIVDYMWDGAKFGVDGVFIIS